MTKRFIVASVIVCVMAGSGWTASAPKGELKASRRPAKVYRGTDGQKVTMVFLEKNEKGDVLLKFEGIDGEWDGKIILHKRVIEDVRPESRHEYYRTDFGGKPWYTVQVSRDRKDANNMPYPFMEVFPYETGANFAIRYSDVDSREVDAKAIVHEFQRSFGAYDDDGKLKKAAADKVQEANAAAVRLYTSGKKKEALVAWQKLLEIDPLNDNARENMRTTEAELQATQ